MTPVEIPTVKIKKRRRRFFGSPPSRVSQCRKGEEPDADDLGSELKDVKNLLRRGGKGGKHNDRVTNEWEFYHVHGRILLR